MPIYFFWKKFMKISSLQMMKGYFSFNILDFLIKNTMTFLMNGIKNRQLSFLMTKENIMFAGESTDGQLNPISK